MTTFQIIALIYFGVALVLAISSLRLSQKRGMDTNAMALYILLWPVVASVLLAGHVLVKTFVFVKMRKRGF